VLVVAEVALSLVLLVGAGLLFRSFLELQSVNSGFNSERVLTMRLSPSGTNFREDPQYIAFYKQVGDRIRALPGVVTVGAINTLPLSKGPTASFRIEGHEPLPVDQWPGANYRNVSPDYFRALNIPIAQGRNFEERDNLSAPTVVLINQANADLNFAGENPVGKRVNFGNVDRNNQPVWFEIVGVVSNVRSIELQEEPLPEIYTSSLQDAFSNMSFVIRASVEPSSLAGAVRQAVQDVDRAQPVSDVRTMENVVSESVMQPRFNLTLLGIFGAIALILSAAGIYGVTSYTAAQRTQEIGVRIALGAQPRDVLKLVLAQGIKLTLIGVVLGSAGALALTRLMKSLLFGVSATDPMTFAAIAVLLTLVAVLACWIPARRAMKVDPMVALRYE
jgi:putative ABC transport system permease protein